MNDFDPASCAIWFKTFKRHDTSLANATVTHLLPFFQYAPWALAELEAYDADTDTTVAREIIVTDWSRGTEILETMSFRPSLPDGRAHKEEDITQARLAAQRNSMRATSTPRNTPPMAGELKLDGSLSVDSASPALSPGPDRRNVVFPDPVAFRLASHILYPVALSLWLLLSIAAADTPSSRCAGI